MCSTASQGASKASGFWTKEMRFLTKSKRTSFACKRGIRLRRGCLVVGEVRSSAGARSDGSKRS